MVGEPHYGSLVVFQVLMGRLLAPDYDNAEIVAIFGAPCTIVWPADDF
jgi:hypothetical protein